MKQDYWKKYGHWAGWRGRGRGSGEWWWDLRLPAGPRNKPTKCPMAKFGISGTEKIRECLNQRSKHCWCPLVISGELSLTNFLRKQTISVCSFEVSKRFRQRIRRKNTKPWDRQMDFASQHNIFGKEIFGQEANISWWNMHSTQLIWVCHVPGTKKNPWMWLS